VDLTPREALAFRLPTGDPCAHADSAPLSGCVNLRQAPLRRAVLPSLEIVLDSAPRKVDVPAEPTAERRTR
jgi:hypothetical protein